MCRIAWTRLFFRVPLPTWLATAVVAASVGTLFPTDSAAQPGTLIPRNGGAFARTEPSSRPEIRLDGSSVETLPIEVADVSAGPDGRAWLQFSAATGRFAPAIVPYGTAGPTLPEIKRDIAAEFAQTSPQVRNCTLCLIEPGGRAWYWASQHATLLGYDGKTWIDYVIPSVSDTEAVRCPTRGALADGRCNVSAGSACWFALGGSVHRFDGAKWSRERVTRTPAQGMGASFPLDYRRPRYAAPSSVDAVLLAVSPDGKVAAASGRRGPIWIWHNAKWECRDDAIKTFGADSRQTGQFSSSGGNPSGSELLAGLVLPNDATLWCLLSSGRLLRVAIGPPPKAAAAGPVPDVQKHINDLAVNDYATRQCASEFLAGKGAAVRTQLQTALAASTDAEQRARLKQLLGRLVQRPEDVSSQRFGSVRVGYVQMLACDEKGNVFALAQSVDSGRGEPRPGLAVLSPTGTTKTVLVDQQFAGPSQSAVPQPLIMNGPGQRLWAPVGGSGPVRVFDLGGDQAADPFPDMQAFGLCAIDGQGHVFARRTAGMSPIIVLKKEL